MFPRSGGKREASSIFWSLERQPEEFAGDLECNFARSVPGVSRFRVNVFVQQQNVGVVMATIAVTGTHRLWYFQTV